MTIDQRETHAGVRERLAWAMARREHHEHEIRRLNKVIEGAKAFLENDADTTEEAAEHFASVSLRPLGAAEVVRTLYRGDQEPTQDEVYEELLRRNYDFGDKSRTRVVTNAMARARKFIRDEQEKETS